MGVARRGYQIWLPGEQLVEWRSFTSPTGDWSWTMCHTLKGSSARMSKVTQNEIDQGLGMGTWVDCLHKQA
ncbi:hypothetical protein PFLUV_G00112030 [Perca fluviatilis]|uniref:Uncharacterized protein n=1 Tax=Perca fluviatilis TaxID=8168 RepID=A0A6A5F4H1_PERFL|nr:hypothetical protein PFLUV_G00112030 [Perca fluviatilis]